MCVTAQLCSKTRFGNEIAHHKLAMLSKLKAFLGPLGRNLTLILSVNTLTDSDFAFLTPKMIHLLDRNQIISNSVNKSEIHPALSQIATFISPSILKRGISLKVICEKLKFSNCDFCNNFYKYE